MKDYVQFLHLSTGYDNATKSFDGPKKNITVCGSDGVFYYDKRLCLRNIIIAAQKRIENLKKVQSITGYAIYKNGRCVHSFASNDLKIEL